MQFTFDKVLFLCQFGVLVLKFLDPLFLRVQLVFIVLDYSQIT